MRNVCSKLGIENENNNIQMISNEEMKNIEGGKKRSLVNACMYLYYLFYKYVVN